MRYKCYDMAYYAFLTQCMKIGFVAMIKHWSRLEVSVWSDSGEGEEGIYIVLKRKNFSER